MSRTGEIIVKTAIGWLNTPYEDNAMARCYGVDCAHLLLGVLIDAGLIGREEFNIPHYSNEWHLHRSEEKFVNNIEKVAEEVHGEPELGDFLLFQYGRCISHGAIYSGKKRVIHAYVDLGVIESSLDDIIFYDRKGRFRLRKIYRFVGRRDA